jgi:Concanavalin A-like lectin/glucanases superfamily
MGAYSTAVLADSPVGFWKMTESGAPLANSGSDSTALTVLQGSPTYQAVQLVPSELLLNPNLPSGQGFQGPSSAAYSTEAGASGVVTVEAWYTPTATAVSQIITEIVGKGSNAGGTTFEYELTLQSGKLAFTLYNPTASTLVGNVTGATTLVAGKTYHVVGTFVLSSGTSTTKVYLNGVQDGTANITLVTGCVAGAGVVWVGVRPDVLGSRFLLGSVGWVAIYGATLSAARILAHFQAGMLGFPSPWVRPTSLTRNLGASFLRRGRSFQGPLAPGTPPPRFFFPFNQSRARPIPAVLRGRSVRFYTPPPVPVPPFVMWYLRGGSKWAPWFGRVGKSFRPGFIPSPEAGAGFPLQTPRAPVSRFGLGGAPSRRGRQFIPPQALQQAGHIVINTASRNLDFVSVRVQPEGLGLASGGAFLPTTEILTRNAAGTWVCYILANTVFSDPTMYYLFTEYYLDGRTKVYKARFPAGAPPVVLLKDYLI